MNITDDQTDNFKLFTTWLNKILKQKLPNGIAAFNFNLYEGVEETYHIQLVGSDEFDEDDADWACSDYFAGDDMCYIPRTEDINPWEKGLDYMTSLVKRYLDEGENANILRGVSAIGIGFVDGDIDIVYRK